MAEPPITIQAAHTSAGSNSPCVRIVIHATSPGMKDLQASQPGRARETAQYFAGASSGGSAHYVVDPVDEQHCVRDAVIAWHAPPNSQSIGIELCADSTYTRADWLEDVVYDVLVMGANRTRELCQRLGVPMVRLTVDQVRTAHRGICSHADVAQAFGDSDHWDPGPGFPWDVFMQMVTVPDTDTEQEDEVADTDVVAEVRVSDRAYYQLQRDGSVKVVGNDRQPIDGEPFRPYYVVANTGQAYYFGPDLNGGCFSYPGLPESARQGSRYFAMIMVTP